MARRAEEASPNEPHRAVMLAIAERAGTDWFQIEDHLARETVGDGGQDASAPAVAGGAL